MNHIRGIGSFDGTQTNIFANTPSGSMFNKDPLSIFCDQSQHVMTRNQARNSLIGGLFNDSDFPGVGNINSQLSLGNFRDSLFGNMDPKLRTRRSTKYAEVPPPLSTSRHESKTRRSEQQPQQPPSSLLNQIKSANANFHVTQLQLQQQIRNQALQALSQKTPLSADFIQKVYKSPGPNYKFEDLENDSAKQATEKPTLNNNQSSRKSDKGLEEENKIKQQLLNLDHQRIQEKRKRKKKSNEEVQILENEYLKNPIWDYEKKCDLALKLKYTFNQIAKWNWDRRKKDEAIGKSNKK